MCVGSDAFFFSTFRLLRAKAFFKAPASDKQEARRRASTTRSSRPASDKQEARRRRVQNVSSTPSADDPLDEPAKPASGALPGPASCGHGKTRIAILFLRALLCPWATSPHGVLLVHSQLIGQS